MPLRDFQYKGRNINNHLKSITTINTIMVSKNITVSYHSDATLGYHMLERRGAMGKASLLGVSPTSS